MKSSTHIPRTALQDDDTFLNFLSATARSAFSTHERTTHPTASHPTAGDLYDYVLGWLADPEANRVRVHLAGCGACASESLRLMQIETELEHDAAAWAAQPAPSETTLPDLAAQIKATLETVGGRVIRWMSDLWEPQWAGQLVTAADIPIQTQVFTCEHGEIEVSCDWQGQSLREPAALHLIWKANFACEQEIWLRVINPETGARACDLCLGTRFSGEENFTHAELGFNPTERRWALSLLLTDVPA